MAKFQWCATLLIWHRQNMAIAITMVEILWQSPGVAGWPILARERKENEKSLMAP